MPNRADTKRLQLREGLASGAPVIAVGAHDAMTAHLIETYGFGAVWVSGFGVSTMAHALPDLNLVTHSEALEAARRISYATELPVIADCDNGFGGLLNVMRTSREFERAGIAGVCIEDNLFPKRNSLYQGATTRELIPTKEQARRIAAAKGEQDTESFLFIARVEALIAGHGVAEACERASAYAEAGADAILIHSRDKTLGEIEGFLANWEGVGEVPLVAVPTLFPTFTAEELGELGFNLIIYANHPMRAAIKAMEETLQVLAETHRASSVDPTIATVPHVFDLVDTRQMIELDQS
jgi:phosphoenolpyruvate phosphomutase